MHGSSHLMALMFGLEISRTPITYTNISGLLQCQLTWFMLTAPFLKLTYLNKSL